MTQVPTTNAAPKAATAKVDLGAKLNLGASSDRQKLSTVAQQFEAIFVRQMLSAARKADLGGSDLIGGSAIATFREMQDNAFADIASQTGALGFAAKIEAQIARFLPPSNYNANAKIEPIPAPIDDKAG